jgi:hypothetical protein
VAVAVKLRSAPSFTVLSPIGFRIGAVLGRHPRSIVIVSESLSGGEPLSDTMTVAGKVPHAVGVQLKAPVTALIVAPEGAPAPRLKVRVFAGMSASVAVAVKVTGAPTVPDLFPMGDRTGATFASVTVTWIVSESDRLGPVFSVAMIVIGNTPGPCASVGVHVNTPVETWIDVPAGAPAPRV